MADIDDVVRLFKEVADAMQVQDNQLPVPANTSPTFIYDRVSAINANPSKTYPAILLDSQPSIDRISAATNFLPKQNCYEFRLFVYDQYNFDQQKIVTLSDKQAKVERIINQYVAEVHNRAINNATWVPFGIYIKNIQTIDGFLAKDVHNSKLVQAYYKVTVMAGTDCVAGSFTYP